MRPARAVIASRVFEPEGAAAALRLGALARALTESGIDVTVLTSRPRESYLPDKKVRRIPVLRDRSGSVRGYLQYASFDIPLFFRLMVTRRPDVLIVEPPPTTGVVCRVVCALRGIPYVYYSADVSSTAAAGIGVNPIVVRILRRVESWVLRGASAVLAVSTGVGDEVVSLGAARSAVTVVGTGIDSRKFSATGQTASVDYPYVVYAGTMSEVHGASVFVEAFAQIADEVPGSRLLMFGDGVELPELKRMSSTLRDRIEFRGTVSPEELAFWLRGGHAGLASLRPDRGYSFAFATKALASLSCGTPVIYSGVGPLRAIVEDRQLGWSVDWQTDAVSVALKEALTHEPSAAQREHVAAVVASDYSLESVARLAVDVVSKTAASRRSI